MPVLAKHPDGMLVWGIPDMTLVPGGQVDDQDELKAVLNSAIGLANSQIKAMALARNLVYIDTVQAHARLQRRSAGHRRRDHERDGGEHQSAELLSR